LLPPAGRVIVMIWTADGIIGNGGLRYFFESDFPDGTLFTDFITAYAAIGAVDCANALRTALTLFPGGYPQPDLEERNELLDKLDNDKGPLGLLDTVFFQSADENVGLIAAYLRAHQSEINAFLKGT
jgi:hypothetical protein